MCPLCKAKKDSPHFFYELICHTCNVPMLVHKEHVKEFSTEERFEIEVFVRKNYPDKKIRWLMRQIMDHAHCHLEDV